MENIKDVLLDFYNIPIVNQITDAALKMILSVFCGGLIGYERQHTHRPAGLRTHILVAVGSTLVMMTSAFVYDAYEGLVNIDPTRLGAQVISGIGFLGAGTIIREGFSVKGLTTAASLWAVSCIGLAIGASYYVGALFATCFIYIILNTLKRFLIEKHPPKNIYIQTDNIAQHSVNITQIIKRYGANLLSFELVCTDGILDTKKDNSMIIKAVVIPRDADSFNLMIDSIRMMKDVKDIYIG